MKYSLTQVQPRIFWVQIKDPYDLAMTFLRYQEFYESPNSKFRGKYFTIIEFMEWYAKKGPGSKRGGVFSYPIDWAGFNIPSSVIENISISGADWNKYDSIMLDIYHKCADTLCGKEELPPPFYLIGAPESGQTLKHEIAHGFFYTNEEYRKAATKLVNALQPDFRKKVYAMLKDMGYTSKVFKDECQAYLSTGFPKTKEITLKGEDKPFVKLFKEYYK